MDKITSAEEYIEQHSEWMNLLTQLREILLSTELEETIKWRAPVYTINGKNVVGIGAFKNHASLWFFQGVFLTDANNKLVNAQEEKTKALRQWRFDSNDIGDKLLIKEYILEAIDNQKQGKQVKPNRNIEVVIPAVLKLELEKNSTFKVAFEKLTKGKQKEYANHIGEAKREATKLSRLQKIVPLVLEGKGLYDKYKNC